MLRIIYLPIKISEIKYLEWEKGTDNRLKNVPANQKITDVLIMKNGHRCNENLVRMTKINFVCGTVDEILYVNEVSTCVYQFDFSSPAAC